MEKREGTVILVSHDPVVLSRSNKVMVLDKGKICQFGKYREIVKDRKGLCYQLVTQGQFNDLEQEGNSPVKKMKSPDGKSAFNFKLLQETENQKVELIVHENIEEEDKWNFKEEEEEK